MEDSITLERVFFVPRRDVAVGNYPFAEPVVLVDLALAHRYPGLRALDVVDVPASSEQAPALTEALPIFAVNQREALLYESARPAVIARDLRSAVPEPTISLNPEDRADSDALGPRIQLGRPRPIAEEPVSA